MGTYVPTTERTKMARPKDWLPNGEVPAGTTCWVQGQGPGRTAAGRLDFPSGRSLTMRCAAAPVTLERRA
jgi:hypothetical protein